MKETFIAKSAIAISIFLLAWFSLALAEGNSDGYSDFDVLQNLTDNGRRNALETFDKIETISKKLDEYVKERLSCLLWEGTVQWQNFNNSLIEAVTKGMSKNKQFNNFQCISDTSRVTFKKLDEIRIQTSVNSQNIFEKGLTGITQFKTIFAGFFSYIQELHQNKKKELEKTKNEGARKKILKEASGKIKLLNSLLDRIMKEAETAKFKTIEEYANFVLKTENNFKHTRIGGTKKMMKCIA